MQNLNFLKSRQDVLLLYWVTYLDIFYCLGIYAILYPYIELIKFECCLQKDVQVKICLRSA